MPADAVPTEASDPLVASEDEQDGLARRIPLRRIAVIGDSLAAGVGDAVRGYRDGGWADRVIDRLREAHGEVAYRNSGRIGATTREVLDEQLDAAVAFRPDLLHLPSGANDLFRRDPDFDAVEADLRLLHDAARRIGALGATFTFGRAFRVPQIPDFGDRIRRMNDLVRGLAGEYDAVLVDMWEHPVNDRPELVSADGIHFSAVGQAVMATETLRALAGRLGPVPA